MRVAVSYTGDCRRIGIRLRILRFRRVVVKNDGRWTCCIIIVVWVLFSLSFVLAVRGTFIAYKHSVEFHGIGGASDAFIVFL